MAVKKDEAETDFIVQFAHGKGQRELSILIETTVGDNAGLGGFVTVE